MFDGRFFVPLRPPPPPPGSISRKPMFSLSSLGDCKQKVGGLGFGVHANLSCHGGRRTLSLQGLYQNLHHTLVGAVVGAGGGGGGGGGASAVFSVSQTTIGFSTPPNMSL